MVTEEKPQKLEKLLTLEEVRILYGISNDTARKMCVSREWKSFIWKNKWRIPESSLVIWQEQQASKEDDAEGLN